MQDKGEVQVTGTSTRDYISVLKMSIIIRRYLNNFFLIRDNNISYSLPSINDSKPNFSLLHLTNIFDIYLNSFPLF